MSVHPFSFRPAPVIPVEPYYQDLRHRDPAPLLRPLTVIEQMYAYWGSDRAIQQPLPN
jgi:hypothetical protein